MCVASAVFFTPGMNRLLTHKGELNTGKRITSQQVRLGLAEP
jgi:hypothetical protein